ncbi:MAG: serine/threonine-protein kinase [Planctomycetota bacterium]
MSDRYQRLKQLFLELRDLPASERAVSLDRLQDAELRRELESLLTAHDEGSRFLDAAASQMEQLGPTERLGAGSRIDEYEILDVLGEGGMGIVYRARQARPERIVALKVIRPGWLNKTLLRRFENEGELLGRLRHPGIAQIYQAGAANSPQGPLPYLAMELVEGEAITDFAELRQLGIRARLGLVAKVCDAAQHAHEKGVVHRDLKPSNILVDDSGHPKILDFGVARVTEPELRTATLETATGQIIGTLPYMSPEQASGDPGRVDPRSDVYAIGVILYELLVGRLPQDLGDKILAEALRMIAEDDVTPPSSIDRVLRGDLETILLTALSKDLARRYSSASALAADIRRYLADEPILARPASTFYQMRKFARRHVGLVAGLTAAFVILLAGTIVATALAIEAGRRAEDASREKKRADREAHDARLARDDAVLQAKISREQREIAVDQRKRAEREAIAATEVSDWLVQLFEINEPNRALGESITARAILDRAAETVQQEMQEQPWLSSRLAVAIGRAYSQLALFEEAEPLIRWGIARQRETERVGPLELATSLHVLGDFLMKRNRNGEAIDCFEESLSIRERELPEDSFDIMISLLGLGTAERRSDRFEDALSHLSRAETIGVATVSENDEHLAQVLGELGNVYQSTAEYEQAAELLERSLDIWSKSLPPGHPRLAQGYNNLGVLQKSLGQTEAAEASFLRTLEILETLFPDGHPNIALITLNVALLWADSGDLERAAPYVERTDLLLKELGIDDWTLTATLSNLRARRAAAAGDGEAASRAFGEAVRLAEAGGGPETTKLATHLMYAANHHRSQGGPEKAMELTRRALTIREKLLPPDHPDIGESLAMLGRILVGQERFDEAEPVLRRALEIEGERARTDTREAWAKVQGQSTEHSPSGDK